MVMLMLSPSASARRWVFYICFRQILPARFWRVLHLVKSHYYGNVRVLEIMARWERLDCFWHNNPTLSISWASSRSHSPYGFLAHFLTLTHLSLFSIAKQFFTRWRACSAAILSLPTNIIAHVPAVWPLPVNNLEVFNENCNRIRLQLSPGDSCDPRSSCLWHESRIALSAASAQTRGSDRVSHWQQIFQVTSIEMLKDCDAGR